MALKKHFPGQLPQEEIVAIVHRHWFNILSHFLTLLFLSIGTLFFFFLAPLFTSLINIALSPSLGYFILSTILLFLWVYSFFIWIDYYFDVWIITDERVLNIEQKGLFTRVMSEVHLGRVQDVTTKIEGFLPTLLHYGDIFVQTAGEEKHFHFRCVGNPDDHKDMIVALARKIIEERYSRPETAQESL